MFNLGLAFNLILVPLTSLARSGSAIPDVEFGLLNPGLAYTNSNELRASDRPELVVEYIRILISPLLFSTLPLLVFFWERICAIKRLLCVIYIAYFICIYISIGTNKLIADFVFIVLFTYAYKVRKVNLKQLFRGIICASIAAMLFLMFFINTQTGRMGEGREGYMPNLALAADYDNVFLTFVPDEMRGGFSSFLSYISQGYYALNLVLFENFDFTYGLGSSVFLTQNIQKFGIGDRVYYDTYVYKLAKFGWDPEVYWSSAYVWLASDLSYVGILLLFFAIGYLIKRLEMYIIYEDPASLILLVILALGIVYVPANNQLLQTGESFFCLFGSILYFILTRRKCKELQ